MLFKRDPDSNLWHTYCCIWGNSTIQNKVRCTPKRCFLLMALSYCDYSLNSLAEMAVTFCAKLYKDWHNEIKCYQPIFLNISKAMFFQISSISFIALTQIDFGSQPIFMNYHKQVALYPQPPLILILLFPFFLHAAPLMYMGIKDQEKNPVFFKKSLQSKCQM